MEFATGSGCALLPSLPSAVLCDLRTVFLLAISSAHRALEFMPLFTVDTLVRHPTGTTVRVEVTTDWHVNLPFHLPAFLKDTKEGLRNSALLLRLTVTSRLLTHSAQPLVLLSCFCATGKPGRVNQSLSKEFRRG